MADEKSSGAWGSSFVVLAFAAVSALYVAHQTSPLVSARPTEPNRGSERSPRRRMCTRGCGRTLSKRWTAASKAGATTTNRSLAENL